MRLKRGWERPDLELVVVAAVVDVVVEDVEDAVDVFLVISTKDSDAVVVAEDAVDAVVAVVAV
jgi:hypothetical protein